MTNLSQRQPLGSNGSGNTSTTRGGTASHGLSSSTPPNRSFHSFDSPSFGDALDETALPPPSYTDLHQPFQLALGQSEASSTCARTAILSQSSLLSRLTPERVPFPNVTQMSHGGPNRAQNTAKRRNFRGPSVLIQKPQPASVLWNVARSSPPAPKEDNVDSHTNESVKPRRTLVKRRPGSSTRGEPGRERNRLQKAHSDSVKEKTSRR